MPQGKKPPSRELSASLLLPACSQPMPAPTSCPLHCQPPGSPAAAPRPLPSLLHLPPLLPKGSSPGPIPPKRRLVPTWEMSPRCWHSTGTVSPVRAGGTARGCCGTAHGRSPSCKPAQRGQGLQTPNKQQPSPPQPAFIPFHPPAPNDSLTKVQPGPGAGLAANHCPGSLSRHTPLQELSPSHCWSLYQGVPAVGTHPGVVAPHSPCALAMWGDSGVCSRCIFPPQGMGFPCHCSPSSSTLVSPWLSH